MKNMSTIFGISKSIFGDKEREKSQKDKYEGIVFTDGRKSNRTRGKKKEMEVLL